MDFMDFIYGSPFFVVHNFLMIFFGLAQRLGMIRIYELGKGRGIVWKHRFELGVPKNC